MKLKRQRSPQHSWEGFYANYGINFDAEPNSQGWVNLNCVLSTHHGRDTERHFAINLKNGHVRCFQDACRTAYIRRLNRNSDLQAFSAEEFLQLVYHMSPLQAHAAVDDYRRDALENDDSELAHDDTGFVKIYVPKPRELLDAVESAQKALKPDLDIVVEYLNSRGLKYSTLERFKAGYIPYDESINQDEAIILPYTIHGELVGIRYRTSDGRKRMAKNSFTCLFNLDVIDLTTSRTAIIAEGETDTMLLTQILLDHDLGNVPVFGIPGVNFKREWGYDLQRFTRIIAVPQRDTAAEQFIRELRVAIPDRLEIVKLPWAARQFGKDVSDFCFGNDSMQDIVIQQLGLSDEDFEPVPYRLTSEELISAGSQPVKWLIPELIERGTKILLIGEPKTFKTWIALQIARSLTMREPLFDIKAWTPTTSHKVVLIEEEGSLQRLGERYISLFGSSTPNFSVIHRQGVRLDEDESLSRLRSELLAIRPDLIIFDPYVSLHSQDENNASGTMIVVHAIDSLIRAMPSTSLLIIHHAPIGGGRARGSSALWGAADTQIIVSSRKSGAITIKIEGRDFPTDIASVGEGEYQFDPETRRHKRIEGIKVHIKKNDSIHQHDLLLDYFAEHSDNPITVEELAEVFSFEYNQVRDLLTKMEQEGWVKSEGEGGWTGAKRWRFAR